MGWIFHDEGLRTGAFVVFCFTLISDLIAYFYFQKNSHLKSRNYRIVIFVLRLVLFIFLSLSFYS